MKEFIKKYKNELLIGSMCYFCLMNLIKAANCKTINIVTH